ncbi:hypothetical protein [Terrabacter sp. NPDC080008]|uniref:hypothetical protein n=1 Tax=Terrabacter sp. NPDC080008 TaxID=3155176 RepID=UPI00344DF7BE
MSKRTLATVVAGLAAMPTLLMLAASPAAAATTDTSVQVSNTETVQAYLDATGKVDVARVYEQVAMKGHGSVELRNPVETRGLRNLDGFGGFDVRDGAMVGHFAVDGEQRLRSVSDYTKKLPLEVSVTYTLDGKPVTPDDVLGRSGHLEVRYTVRNVTGRPQVVTFDDGTGHSASATQSVVIPMVGSLTTTLPDTFTNVGSKEAAVAGDGHGGTKLTYTMTLFGPIGTPTATFGYSADIVDGTLPKANVSALPVSPLESPSFKGGAESYKGGAATGATLTAGATEIDANLLKLRDGAGSLLAGLIQLRDGAKKLDAGLGAQALPGSRELASGAGQLEDGTAQLRSGATTAKDGSSKVAGGASRLANGAGQLDAGAAKLSGGASQVDDGAAQVAGGLHLLGDNAPQLLDGLSQVADGLDQVDAGLTQLYDGVGGLPEQAKPLHAGISRLRAGLGAKGLDGTLIDGVDQVRAGLAAATEKDGSLDQLAGGLDQVKDGVSQVRAGIGKGSVSPDTLVGGVTGIRSGLTGALAPTGGVSKLDDGVAFARKADCGPGCQTILGQVQDGLGLLRTQTRAAADGLTKVLTGLGDADAGLEQVTGGLGRVSGGLGLLKTKLGAAALGLAKVECGLSNTTLKGVCNPEVPGLLEGVGLVDGGVSQLVDGVLTKVQGGIGTPTDHAKDKTLRGGVNDLQSGVDLLGLGGLDLLDAVDQITTGADQVHGGTSQVAKGAKDLSAGASTLAKGSGDLASGAGQLDTGVGQLADGAGRLDDGARRLNDGAGQLASGLADAADGTSRLSAGLTDAAAGAPQLQDGAQKLSDDGTKKLVAAGKATAADYGEKYALIEVGAQRAKTEGMAYGAPEGATGATAYSFELAGVDGQGSANAGRAAAAAGVFGLAGGAALLRRRLL